MIWYKHHKGKLDIVKKVRNYSCRSYNNRDKSLSTPELFFAIDAIEKSIKFSTSFIVEVVVVKVYEEVVRNASESATMVESEPIWTIGAVVAVLVEVVVDVIKLK